MASDTPPASTETVPTTAAELARFVAENAQGPRRPLFPVGGRTALHYGFPAAVEDGVLVSTARLDDIVDYPE
ncbi:MAG: hypothetical protein KY476_11075, partial [Planctomycetes bacterium]|nr:hypothetical protein [Planctomycetota bacterium]